ncbi:UDP-glucose 4-epimerase GalE [Haploplasma modicum]|uniref:UDP-glucose 4-epimerase GalE n=1 Tax=Haploplasma modicum TaxID=2150 RepID=UPI00047AA173|nr:UDP-glucose 4-epimerase GalE [Haploplasma modicum]
MKILITGGTGYIGSHTAVELIKDGHEVVIVDDLSNSFEDVIDKIKTITNVLVPFHKIDCKNYDLLDKLFKEENFDGIIHFAGFKAVGESTKEPLKYYENNLLSTINLAKLMEKYDVSHFIFSSSATVYGDQPSPLSEKSPLMETTNPYGETKKMCERILNDYAKNRSDKTIVLLRYFNPIGAHKSGLLGEIPQGTPNNLMPYITQVASKKRDKLFIFGNDYDTVDGTGVRDYIHVVDLAKGHLAALNKANKGCSVYNLGTGVGISVLELVETFKKINKIDIPYEIVARRAGDIATVYASSEKAFKELNWETSLSVEDMVRDSWNFEKNIE